MTRPNKFSVIKPELAPIPSRKVDALVIHHSASSRTNTSAQEIERWHKKRDFTEIGYHFVINHLGEIIVGRDIEKTPASVKGHNRGTIAVVCTGNFSLDAADEPYHPQFLSLARLVNHYRDSIPDLRIVGHRELAATECPGLTVDLDKMQKYFDAVRELQL